MTCPLETTPRRIGLQNGRDRVGRHQGVLGNTQDLLRIFWRRIVNSSEREETADLWAIAF